MREAFDPWLHFDERAEIRDAGDSSGSHLADRVCCRHLRPRIGEQLLQSERDLLSIVLHAQHLDGDVLAGLDYLRRRDVRPAHLARVEQALYAAPEIHECTEVAY